MGFSFLVMDFRIRRMHGAGALSLNAIKKAQKQRGEALEFRVFPMRGRLKWSVHPLAFARLDQSNQILFWFVAETSIEFMQLGGKSLYGLEKFIEFTKVIKGRQ